MTRETLFINQKATPQNQELGPVFERLVACPPGDASRKELVNVVVSNLVAGQTIRKWTANLVKRYHLGNEADDVEQIISETVTATLYAVTRSDVERTGALYIPWLWHKVKAAVMLYQESGARSGMSGTSGIVRRQKQIRKARAELRNAGEEPTDREIITHVNAEMYEKRANPARQGMLLSEDDFRTVDPKSLDADSPAGGTSYAEALDDNGSTEDHILTRVQLDEAVRSLTTHLRRTYPKDPVLMRCSVAWMRCVFVGIEPTLPQITSDTGCLREECKRALRILQTELASFRERHA